MKKLVLALSIFAAFTASAQQGKKDVRKDVRNERTEYHQTQGNFSGLRLTSAQQRKIDLLSRERLSQREYDAKIRRILTKQQYAKFSSYQKSGFKNDKKVAVRGFR